MGKQHAWPLFLALAIAVASSTSRAEPPPAPPGEFPFVAVGAQVGLTQISPWAVAQDSVGYLWIASDAGVFRYDGRTAVQFGRAEGIPSPLVQQLVVGRDDTVWAVSTLGLTVYRDGKWAAPRLAQSGIGIEAVRRIAVDARGRFLATTPRGLVREEDDGSLTLDTSFTHGAANGVFSEPTGALFIATHGAVHLREPSGVERTWDASSNVPNEEIYSIVRDAHGRIVISSSSHVSSLAAGAARFESWPALDHGETFLSLDRKGQAWLASEAGLHYADGQGTLHAVQGLASHRTTHVFEDDEGSLWVSGFGLFRLAGRGLWRNHSHRQGLPDDTIWDIQRTADGQLWAGTQRGLARATATGWARVTQIPEVPVRSAALTASGEMWLAGAAGTLYRYDPRSGRVVAYGAERGVPDARTLIARVDHDGTVWVGGLDGLVRSVGRGEDLRFERVPLEGATPPTVRDLWVDAAGRLWVASWRGLFVKEGERWTRLGVPQGLRSESADRVIQRKSGEMCAVETDRGVSCFRYENGRATSLWYADARSGLASDVVYLLGEDARGRLWVGTNVGVDVQDRGGFTHYDVQTGMPHYDCDRAFWAEPNGDVWVGTSRGLGQFFGAEEVPPTRPARVVLSGRRVKDHGEATAVKSGDELPHADSNVAFRFAALSFVREFGIQYETRLIGLDPEWHATTSDEMRFAALAPDHYDFQVRARLPGAPWSEPTSMRFSVGVPWWQRAWFRVLVACAALALVEIARRLGGRAVRRRNEALERLVAERTRELAKAQSDVARAEKLSALGRVLAQLSHELNNPLNVVSNNVQPLEEYVGSMRAMLVRYRGAAGGDVLEGAWADLDLDFVLTDVDEALAAIATAARRACAIQTDLRTFLHGGEVRKVSGDLNRDLRETVQMIRRQLPPGVKVDVDYGDLPPVAYESGRINQVFMNLLQNAADAVGAEGTIAIKTSAETGSVRVRIADTGPGIRAGDRDGIFEPFFTTKAVGKGTGLGLPICRQIIVEQHGGTLALDETSTKGAAFVVTLPAPSTASW